MSRLRVIPAVLLLLLFPLLPVSVQEDDVECLRQVKQKLSDPTGYLSNWVFDNSSAGYVCNFVGVTCWHLGENKVFSLKLPGGGLMGDFPSGLYSCQSLQQLDLSDNILNGSIPSDLCKQLPYLTTLDLSSNKFSGPIPDNLGKCKYLNILNLQHNQLNGSIPWQIGVLDRLKGLDLSYNELSGPIPSSFTNRSEVKQQGFAAAAFVDNPNLCGPPLSAGCGSSSGSSSPKIGVIVGVLIGAAIAILLVALFVWWLLPRRKGKATPWDEHKWAKRIRTPKSITVSMFEKTLVKMRLSELMAATNEFSKQNIICVGRTGTMYKATLSDGSVLAIKRLSASAQTDKQFKTEMNTLGQLRHKNLVPLLGYCIAGGEKLLVYKHMSNGSLLNYLHNVPEESKLNWAGRLKIGIGAARGLAWLHHSCNPRIIHRNISTSSILLDEEGEARISDFGLARLMNPVDTHISTFINGDFGDVGYVAPEYLRTLVATIKGDVYSFGVVLLELVTGQRALEVSGDSNFKGNLVDWIAHLSKSGRLNDAIDISLRGNGVDDELVQFLKVACTCVLSGPKQRPTMYELYQMLQTIGMKYNFTAQYDEIPLGDTGDTEYSDELIVAMGK